jgi:hypothetical protein
MRYTKAERRKQERTMSSRPTIRRRVGATLASLAMLTALTPNAMAAAVVTRGEFNAFNGSTLPISGQATMVRTADGRTIVTIQVTGLEPGLTYPSHVHAQACADGLAGGHYKFDPAGAVTPPNEIWPGPFTTNPAGAGRGHTVAQGTAGQGAVSVVIHAPGGAKIACADLG